MRDLIQEGARKGDKVHFNIMTICVYLGSIAAWMCCWFFWVRLPGPFEGFLVVPFVAFVASSLYNLVNEGLREVQFCRSAEIEKLKLLDESGGRLVALLALLIAIPWLRPEILPVAVDATFQLRGGEFQNAGMLLTVSLLGGLLPMFWSVPSGKADEVRELHGLRHFKTAMYSHALGWLAVVVVRLLEVLFA